MSANYDYAGLNARLLGQCPDLLRLWLPGGVVRGKEYVCAGLTGGRGESLSVSLSTGAWAEFNGMGAKGGDLVSLYAAINGQTQGQAFKELGGQEALPAGPLPVVSPNVRPDLGPPPPGEYPDVSGAEAVYDYRDGNGALLFLVVRYPGKRIRPKSWDVKQRRWVDRGWPTPRPLFGLELLAERPQAAVLVVEGEKAVLAARELAGEAYVCVTWPNGAAAVGSADWSVLRGRRVLIWPDADAPGVAARDAIIAALRGLCPEVKYLQVDDLSAGFDAADWSGVADAEDWFTWAKPRVVVAATEAVVVPAGAGAPTVAVTLIEDHAPLPESIALLCETYGLAVKGASGAPVTNLDNIARVMAVVPGFKAVVWWDEFYQSVRTRVPRGWVGADVRTPGELVTESNRDWTDADTLALTMRLQRWLGFQGVTTAAVMDAVTLAAHMDVRCAPADWMRGLEWDGVSRLETWVMEAMGCVDTAYSRAVGKNLILSMVARTLRPGCQVDTMLVVEGLQGAGKSSLFNALAGEGWYAEATEAPTSKDFFMVLRGKLIVEVAELDAFSRVDVTRIKQLLSCRTDRYREPYGRLTADHPRRSVFVGTTNETQYLRDATGARRFWPLEATRIDLEWVRRYREQLFAEAVHRYSAGESWWVVPEVEAQEVAESRRVHDEMEFRVAEYIQGKSGVTITDVWCYGLNRRLDDLDRATQWRMGQILRSLRWTAKVEWLHPEGSGVGKGRSVRMYRPIDPPF